MGNDVSLNLMPDSLPDSIDHAINNLTDMPTKSTGRFWSDLIDLITYSVHGAAERKRLQVDEKIEQFAIERQARIENFKNEISQKYEQIPVENRIEPTEKTLAILDDAAFCLENDEIRKMFANLIAKSVDSEYVNKTIPAFSGIIKQLSPLDAKIFKVIASDRQSIAIKEMYIGSEMSNARIKFMFWATSIEFSDIDSVSVTLNNLLRLGLLKEGGMLFYKELYENIDKNPVIQDYYSYVNSKIKDPINEKLMFNKKSLELTALGNSFYDICCKDTD